jgi:hypothetical protein
MLRAPSRRYLYCQTVGWGVLLVIFIASSRLFLHLKTINSLEHAFVTVLIGFFTTHLLRNTIRNQGWLNLPLRQGLPWLLLGTVWAAMAAGLIRATFISLGGMTLARAEPLSWYARVFGAGLEYILLFLPWTIMYCLYYHVQKTRQKNAEIRRLELLLKERSATAADTALDIESITRSLDHIRSLIGEDAAGARAEITAFSQLLRTGYLKVNDPQ